MKIKTFIKNYKAAENKEDFLKSHMTKNYISFGDKLDVCSRIVGDTYFKIDPKTSKPKFRISSVTRYLLYTLKLIEKYTDITVDYTIASEEYDLLNKENLIKTIKLHIPNKEKEEFEMIMGMVVKDVVDNEYAPEAYLANRATEVGEGFAIAITPALEKLANVVEGIDINEVIKEFGKNVDIKDLIKLIK